jgi:hypothetical protein
MNQRIVVFNEDGGRLHATFYTGDPGLPGPDTFASEHWYDADVDHPEVYVSVMQWVMNGVLPK